MRLQSKPHWSMSRWKGATKGFLAIYIIGGENPKCPQRFKSRIRPSQWCAVRKKKKKKRHSSRIKSALQWLVQRISSNGVRTYSLLRLGSLGSFRARVRVDHWSCHGECKGVNSSSAKKTVELPALYIHANFQIWRHKLIAQLSNLFPSCIVCLIIVRNN